MLSHIFKDLLLNGITLAVTVVTRASEPVISHLNQLNQSFSIKPIYRML